MGSNQKMWKYIKDFLLSLTFWIILNTSTGFLISASANIIKTYRKSGIVSPLIMFSKARITV